MSEESVKTGSLLSEEEQAIVEKGSSVPDIDVKVLKSVIGKMHRGWIGNVFQHKNIESAIKVVEAENDFLRVMYEHALAANKLTPENLELAIKEDNNAIKKAYEKSEDDLSQTKKSREKATKLEEARLDAETKALELKARKYELELNKLKNPVDELTEYDQRKQKNRAREKIDREYRTKSYMDDVRDTYTKKQALEEEENQLLVVLLKKHKRGEIEDAEYEQEQQNIMDHFDQERAKL